VKIRLLFALVALALVAAACGDDSDPSEASSASDEATVEDAEPTGQVSSEWEEHVAGGDCQCADGSDYRYFSRTADTDKVLLYFQGGGACFSAESCSFTDGTYLVQANGFELGADASGIFDFDNGENPFADWSVVYMPYCTGDVHIGNNVQQYSEDLTVNHVGFLNANHGLDYVVDNFGDASEVMVAGSSAGGIPAPLFGGLVADELPDAEVAVLSDASGGYPDNPPINLTIGGLWGAYDNVPDWSVNEDVAPEEWSIPGFFTQAGLHAPEVRMARYDNAYDDVQRQFSQLSEIGEGDVLTVVQANEESIEASGVPIHRYVAPCTFFNDTATTEIYTLEVEGVSFLDWLTRYVAGEDVEDVACTDCGEPGTGDDITG
jgi:acetyl esterase/lipase